MRHIRVTLGRGRDVWTREFRGEAIRWHVSQLGNLSILEEPVAVKPGASLDYYSHCQVTPAAVFAQGQWIGVENVEATDLLRGTPP